ncbi:hypothetical protein PsorP6_007860 [Peronosclerospora sorghi]|uniref:Uncharacterized protein n=1 Tax=Peronosclerospora sorghi TaxID=230839 RepID=A0ACC0W9J6_9STRA|nr:hypothetical protein PsorP6_007860 [Peronosclerospora sorghi]
MNPEALFSVETPSTLMTEEEFTRFSGRSNQRGAPVFSAAPRVAQKALNSTLLASSEKDWTTSGFVATKTRANVDRAGPSLPECHLHCWAAAHVSIRKATQAGEAAVGTVSDKIDDDELEDCHHLVRETFIEMATKRYIFRIHPLDLKVP